MTASAEKRSCLHAFLNFRKGSIAPTRGAALSATEGGQYLLSHMRQGVSRPRDRLLSPTGRLVVVFACRAVSHADSSVATAPQAAQFL